METRTIIFSVAGLGIGFGAGFIFAKKKYEKKCAEEIEFMRNTFKKKEEEGETATEKLNSIKNYISEHYSTATVKDVVEQGGELEFVRREEDFEQEQAESEAPEEGEIRKSPYAISNTEYFEGKDLGIGKRALIYYAGNDTLIDEETEEVQDLDQIGEENLQYFNKYEDLRLFVRNEALGEDYEVIFEEGSYNPNDGEGA